MITAAAADADRCALLDTAANLFALVELSTSATRFASPSKFVAY
jgi:hypothetical protein